MGSGDETTSRPPDVIHVIGVPRFSRSSASVYYTERKPNKKRGRPGNEANLRECSDHVSGVFDAHFGYVALDSNEI